MEKLGNVFILGDSYSTFVDWIPDGYACYYCGQIAPDFPQVKSVEETWWHRLLSETDSKLLRNDSWSGSTVCNTGYDGEDFSDCSFVNRFDKFLKDGNYLNQPVDTLFVFGGTNDSWADVPLGELSENDLYCFLPAVRTLAEKIKTCLPDTRAVFVVNCDLKEEVANGIIDVCKRFDFECVVLHDIDKLLGHPTAKGMREIKDQIMSALFH